MTETAPPDKRFRYSATAAVLVSLLASTLFRRTDFA